MHSNSLFAKYVVNNWQLSSITTLMSGRPTGSLTIRLNDTPVTGMLYSADALDGFNGNFRVPFLPVNSLYTPWVQQENFRLTKIHSDAQGEASTLSLMFEAFNIANNWSPTSLATQAYTEAKGVLTYTPTAFGVWIGRRRVPGRHTGPASASRGSDHFLAGVVLGRGWTLTGIHPRFLLFSVG